MNENGTVSSSGVKAPELTEKDIQILAEKANDQFRNELQLPDTASIEALAEDVVRKCLRNASALLDEKRGWVGDSDNAVLARALVEIANAVLARALIEIANEANKLVPYERDPLLTVSSPFSKHTEADKKVLADTIREILTEQTSSSTDPAYT